MTGGERHHLAQYGLSLLLCDVMAVRQCGGEVLEGDSGLNCPFAGAADFLAVGAAFFAGGMTISLRQCDEWLPDCRSRTDSINHHCGHALKPPPTLPWSAIPARPRGRLPSSPASANRRFPSCSGHRGPTCRSCPRQSERSGRGFGQGFEATRLAAAGSGRYNRLRRTLRSCPHRGTPTHCDRGNVFLHISARIGDLPNSVRLRNSLDKLRLWASGGLSFRKSGRRRPRRGRRQRIVLPILRASYDRQS